MSHLVRVKAGKSGIQLPNGGAYDAGDEILLTDDEWGRLSSSAKTNVLDDITPSEGGGGASASIGDVLYLTRADTVDATSTGFTPEDASEDSVGTSILWDDSAPTISGWGYPLIKVVEAGTYSVMIAAIGNVSSGPASFIVTAELMDEDLVDIPTLPRYALRDRVDGLAESFSMTLGVHLATHLPAGTLIDFSTGGSPAAFTDFALHGRVQRIA